MKNDLLNQKQLPSFSTIVPTEIEPLLKEVLNENRQKRQKLLANVKAVSWNTLLVPLEDMDNQLNKMWSPISHLHSVMESDELRAAYNACLPLLTEYHTELMQNETHYQAIKTISESPDFKNLHAAQRKVIENELRDFRLSGVSLPADKKLRFAELQKKLSKLTTQFSENLLDATHGWTFHVTELELLTGLPEQTLEIAAQNAKQKSKTGWILTLDYPCYSSVIKYLANRDLRKTMYEAYVTRASDVGPNAGRFDNTKLMEDIVQTRHELAQLLNFPSFAEYSLATKMAHDPNLVLTFLNDLVTKSKKSAEADMQELTEFAKSQDGITTLEPWDLPYYGEKLQESKYSISQEELRQYFPVNKVLEGMFTVMGRLFGIKIVERHDVDIWHPHVQFFEVYDNENNLRGYFYTDLYARPHKKDGAWMDECRVRQILPDNTLQYPVAFLTCNFMRPIGDKPGTLTHDEVQTVFHEFGHCLHHLLTQVDYAPVSGINGVPWDAVEFPSQFFEHWCWDKESLTLISAHETTGESLPDALYKKLIAAKNFQSGMQMLRQLEFALFDFRLHLEFDPSKGPQVQKILDDVRLKTAVVPTAKFNRFQHSFSHIFSGGYAAGYYSYKWAEVLSSDAFSRFEEQGVFDRVSGRAFLNNILEQGGVCDPMDLFVAFRGRLPTIDALLRHSGLA
ncbi:MAG: M3 family metallopeptidase [Gammaproteobacteria bacterium]